MVVLLQGLTNRLNSEQMSTRRHISISQTDRDGSAIKVIISSWSELTLVSSMSNRLCWSPQHKNCLTGLLRIKTVQYFKSNQGWDLVCFFVFFITMTHLFIISLCDNNLCRNDCSPTCLSSRNALSSLPLNQRLGGRARSKLGNSNFNYSKGNERLDDRWSCRSTHTFSLKSQW